MTTLICDCNQTMALDAVALGTALNESLTLHSTLCRRDAGAFVRAAESGEELVVACTQEKRLFSELATQSAPSSAPIRFVNIRETGGWSKDGAKASAKIAALLAAAHLPDSEAVATVSFKSTGRLLVIGGLASAERAAELLGDGFDTTLFTQGAGDAGAMQERRYPVLGGRIDALTGWLGAFELKWTRDNAIDLDLCTRCNACLAVCPEGAIGLDYQIDMGRSRQQIKVNPSLCVGCGSCTTVCPSGALSFAYPRASEQGVRIKTLLATYARCGGKDAALLLHSQQAGTAIIGDLGRAARLDPQTHGVPARVMPLALWHTASLGLELWLSAIAYGASQVWVLMTQEEAPQYHQALQEQMALGQAILSGLGYQGTHFRLLHARDARDLASLDRDLREPPAQGVARAASFAAQAEKRATLELALEHLIAQAPARAEMITLPASGSPLGALALDKEACTMCLSCVNACTAGALQYNAQAPELRFIEKNCVQCGLCVSTCPENALRLIPRLNLAPQRKEAVLINAMQPYACVRCGKAFGTLKAIEAMLGKLAGHSMFQGAAAERLKMCGDCRVIDIYSADNEAKITEL